MPSFLSTFPRNYLWHHTYTWKDIFMVQAVSSENWSERERIIYKGKLDRNNFRIFRGVFFLKKAIFLKFCRHTSVNIIMMLIDFLYWLCFQLDLILAFCQFHGSCIIKPVEIKVSVSCSASPYSPLIALTLSPMNLTCVHTQPICWSDWSPSDRNTVQIWCNTLTSGRSHGRRERKSDRIYLGI